MLRIITDFDGPVMDVSERYYQVYCWCLSQASEQSLRPMTKRQFWELKRAKVSEYEIGMMSGLNDVQAAAFSRLRKQTVHKLEHMVHDRLIPQAKPTLQKLQALRVDLVVMTMRRTAALEFAFQQYGLGQFFAKDRRYCLSEDYVKTKDVEDKPKLMAQALEALPRATETWMIGDTEADIVSGKTHGIQTIGVLSGIRDRQRLEYYQPDFIVDNLASAVETILDRALLQVG